MENYHVYEEIGKGRYSTLYRGRQKKCIEYVALKRVEKTQIKLVRNEVQMMHSLDSKFAIKFHMWYETSRHLWLILEYCPGSNLGTVLKQELRLPERALRVLGTDLMCGMHYLHSRAIIYANLKPSTVLVDEFGTCKLSDFRYALRVPATEVEGGINDEGDTEDTGTRDTDDRTAETESSQSEAGATNGASTSEAQNNGDPSITAHSPASGRRRVSRRQPGTPCYMAPELFGTDESGDGCMCRSYASDTWSLGIVLHELFTGRTPFVDTSLDELARQIAYDEPLLLRGDVGCSGDPVAARKVLSAELRSLLSSLLTKVPEQRLSWPALSHHPFWHPALAEHEQRHLPASMPPQPLFEAMLERRKARAERRAAALRSRKKQHEDDLSEVYQSPKTETIGQHDKQRLPQDAPGDMHGQHGNQRKQDANEAGHVAHYQGADAACLQEHQRRSEQQVTGEKQVVDQSDAQQEADEAALAALEVKEEPGLLAERSSASRSASFATDTEASIVSSILASEAVIRPDTSVSTELREDIQAASVQDLASKQLASDDTDGCVTDGTDAMDGHDHVMQLQANLPAAHILLLSPHAAVCNEHGTTMSANMSEVLGMDMRRTCSSASELAAAVQVAADGAIYGARVEPVVFNPRIDARCVRPPRHRAAALPFNAPSPTEVAALSHPALEAFLGTMYRALAAAGPAAQKANITSYAHALAAASPELANLLVNSSFVTLLLKLALRCRSDALRARLVLLVGDLIRHATFVLPDSGEPEAGSVDQGGSAEQPRSVASRYTMLGALTSLTSYGAEQFDGGDKEIDAETKAKGSPADADSKANGSDVDADAKPRVRRRAMAALGELLFYVSTLDSGGGGSTSASSSDGGGELRWHIPTATIDAVLRCLRPTTASAASGAAPRRAAARTLLNMFSHAASFVSGVAVSLIGNNGSDNASSLANGAKLKQQFKQVEKIVSQGATMQLLAIARDAPSSRLGSAPNSGVSPNSNLGTGPDSTTGFEAPLSTGWASPRGAESTHGSGTLRAWAASGVAAVSRYLFAAAVVEGWRAITDTQTSDLVLSVERLAQLAHVLASPSNGAGVAPSASSGIVRDDMTGDNSADEFAMTLCNGITDDDNGVRRAFLVLLHVLLTIRGARYVSARPADVHNDVYCRPPPHLRRIYSALSRRAPLLLPSLVSLGMHTNRVDNCVDVRNDIRRQLKEKSTTRANSRKSRRAGASTTASPSEGLAEGSERDDVVGNSHRMLALLCLSQIFEHGIAYSEVATEPEENALAMLLRSCGDGSSGALLGTLTRVGTTLLQEAETEIGVQDSMPTQDDSYKDCLLRVRQARTALKSCYSRALIARVREQAMGASTNNQIEAKSLRVKDNKHAVGAVEHDDITFKRRLVRLQLLEQELSAFERLVARILSSAKYVLDNLEEDAALVTALPLPLYLAQETARQSNRCNWGLTFTTLALQTVARLLTHFASVNAAWPASSTGDSLSPAASPSPAKQPRRSPPPPPSLSPPPSPTASPRKVLAVAPDNASRQSNRGNTRVADSGIGGKKARVHVIKLPSTSPVGQAQASPRCPSPWLSRVSCRPQPLASAPAQTAEHSESQPTTADRGPLLLLVAEALVCFVLRHAAVEAETEAYAEAGSQAQAQGDAEAASMKDAMLQAERSLAAARSASAGGGIRVGTQQHTTTSQSTTPSDRQYAMLRLATVLAQHLLPALASVSIASSSAHGDARAHALQLLVNAVVQLGQLTQSSEPVPSQAHKHSPCWRRRLASTVCTALQDSIIKDCCATLADFQPLPQWCLRMYAFALRRWPSLAEQFTFDGAWDQDNKTGEGMMCLKDVRIQGHFVDGVPSGKCTVTITRATEAKSFDFNFDDQH